ncbi:MAG TPA: hypothetical protein PLU06_04095 [Candidatus Syntrophosphaera sp.]|jgi:hypothetical protein|nr:hypothetical protein [Candidatus Syntrophosphaera sp.]HRQ67913.1 hypothetical protein [Candidatus Syntrophosphaera sp.]
MHSELKDYLLNEGKAPLDYVLDKFENHEIVLLGEMHYIRQQVEMYHRLIPLLPEHGINLFATEFGRREDQALIDELLGKEQFDFPLAKLITLRQEAFWGYQEYLDVYRLIWEQNRKNPPDRQIRCIGLNDPYNWKLYNKICREQKREPNAEERKLIWKDCDEKNWLRALNKYHVPGVTKVLGIMGSHHAFTRYREPDFTEEGGRKVFAGFNKVRFGNQVHEEYGDAVCNICFYDPWDSLESDAPPKAPGGGIIEDIISPHFSELAFDLKDSPVGELADDSFYSLGYKDFRLRDISDGMIYTCKLTEFKNLTPIPDFIDTDNLQEFRDYAPFNYDTDKSCEEINRIIAESAEIW